MATTKVTTADFAEVVLKSKTPVLVDFWAEWIMGGEASVDLSDVDIRRLS